MLKRCPTQIMACSTPIPSSLSLSYSLRKAHESVAPKAYARPLRRCRARLRFPQPSSWGCTNAFVLRPLPQWDDPKGVAMVHQKVQLCNPNLPTDYIVLEVTLGVCLDEGRLLSIHSISERTLCAPSGMDL